MRKDVQELLAKQAQWQRSRAMMSWGDKLRSSVAMRSSIEQLRKQGATIGPAVPAKGRTG